MPYLSGQVARPKGSDKHDTTTADLDRQTWGGIVSARLAEYAAALGCTPDEVLAAIEAAGVEPMTDTAEPKGRGPAKDRPTDPELRSLALTTEDLEAVREALAAGP
jgi:hypothetical protein